MIDTVVIHRLSVMNVVSRVIYCRQLHNVMCIACVYCHDRVKFAGLFVVVAHDCHHECVSDKNCGINCVVNVNVKLQNEMLQVRLQH